MSSNFWHKTGTAPPYTTFATEPRRASMRLAMHRHARSIISGFSSPVIAFGCINETSSLTYGSGENWPERLSSFETSNRFDRSSRATSCMLGLSSCLRLFSMSLNLDDMPDIMPLRARRVLERPMGGPRPLPRKPAAKGSSAPSMSMSRGLSASLLSLGSTGGGVVFSVLRGLEVVSSSLTGVSASFFEDLLFWRRATGVCVDGEVSVGVY